MHEGERYRNSKGLIYQVISYKTWDNVTVRFEIDGTEVTTTYQNVKKGQVKHPTFKWSPIVED